MLVLELLKCSLHIFEVSGFCSKLLTHWLFKLVECHFQVLDVLLTILYSSLLFRKVSAQSCIDWVLGIEIILRYVGSLSFSLKLETTGLNGVTLVLYKHLILPQFLLLCCAFDFEVFEAQVKIWTCSFILFDAVVKIFYLLAVASDFAHELVNTSIPVTHHFTLMLKLAQKVIFPLLCLFKSHVLEPNRFLKLVGVLI